MWQVHNLEHTSLARFQRASGTKEKVHTLVLSKKGWNVAILEKKICKAVVAWELRALAGESHRTGRTPRHLLSLLRVFS